jgi:tRNA(Arg) A34 adenosine deaminase TadA
MNPETVSLNDTRFMTEALGLAQTALVEGEFPVGCVIATNDRVVARGYRTGTVRRIGKRDRPR